MWAPIFIGELVGDDGSIVKPSTLATLGPPIIRAKSFGCNGCDELRSASCLSP